MPTTSIQPLVKGSMLKIKGSRDPDDYFKGYLRFTDEQDRHLVFDMFASDGFKYEQGNNDPIFRYKRWWDSRMTELLRRLGHFPLTVIFEGFICLEQEIAQLDQKSPTRLVARGAYCFKVGEGFLRIEGCQCDIEIP